MLRTSQEISHLISELKSKLTVPPGWPEPSAQAIVQIHEGIRLLEKDYQDALKRETAQMVDVDKPLSTREKSTLLKLIIGMAIKGYKYNRENNRSEVIPEIVKDLDLLGISLDDETVRKWLKLATKELPAKAQES